MARYRQIKAFVMRQIDDGVLKPGDRVPSEAELVRQFGVSRMTVNRALRELTGEGLVRRVAGSGTFVDASRNSSLLRIESIADEVRARGDDYAFRLLILERRAATDAIAGLLDIAAGADHFYSECLHCANGMPIQLEYRHISPSVAPGYGEQAFTRISPGEYLYEVAPISEVEHVIEAAMPTPVERALLRLDRAEPCLIVTRRTWSRGVPATWSRLLHPGKRYRLGSRFPASDGAGTD